MIKDLAERLQKQRKERNLSQKRVAEMTGLSTTLISNFERGERTPSLESIISLANVYHCSIDYLLGREIKRDIDTSMLTDIQVEMLQEFLISMQSKDNKK